MSRRREGPSDYLSILAGTSQNLVGLVLAALATFAVQIVLTRALGPEGFGVVTVLTQAVFVLSFATRAGMDMAVLRSVAIETGRGRLDLVRAPVARAVLIAGLVSVIASLLVVSGASVVRSVLSLPASGSHLAVQAAALGLPFAAIANVWLSATRGLKIMRYTLYIFWAGQPLAWIGLTLAGFAFAETSAVSVLAYSASWIMASAAAFAAWRKESAGFQAAPLQEDALGRLVRFAGPRAPAALFSQLLFWTDLFVLTHYATGTQVGVYSAALRAGQVVVLFLTSVNLMFSPYVADLHGRGETERLDALFKTLTRWTLAVTLPAFLLIAVAPENVLGVFGAGFAQGRDALLILLAGQLVNIATGSAGFVLIMAGRTGWDLLVIGVALALDLLLAILLCPRYGMTGAAVANAVTFAVSNAARLALVRKFVGIQPYDRNYARLVPPALVGGLTMLLVHLGAAGGYLVNLVLTGAAGAGVYGAAYLLLGVTPGERRVALSLLRRR